MFQAWNGSQEWLGQYPSEAEFCYLLFLIHLFQKEQLTVSYGLSKVFSICFCVLEKKNFFPLVYNLFIVSWTYF